MPTTIQRLFLLGCLLIPLAACQTVGTREGEEGAAVEDRTGAAGTAGLDESSARARELARGPAGTFRGRSIDDPSSPISRRIIYFDYDSDAIRDEYRPVLEAHAAYLGEQPSLRGTLEGHTDERGSREYNLGLGERRGQAVKRVLGVLGASSSQVSVVSYGEERPAADGHDESAWAQNRRVEILYRARQ
jgi:peptidoglycan-associated lipoprotein